jgi:N-terminal acetyltransferase B complex non-catalytic subunit
MDLLVAYFAKFGSKSCCFEDLSTYISSLEKADAEEFCTKLRETAGEKSETIKEVAIQINIARFERFIGLQAKLRSADTMALVNKLWKLYEEALPLGKIGYELQFHGTLPMHSYAHTASLHVS